MLVKLPASKVNKTVQIGSSVPSIEQINLFLSSQSKKGKRSDLKLNTSRGRDVVREEGPRLVVCGPGHAENCDGSTRVGHKRLIVGMLLLPCCLAATSQNMPSPRPLFGASYFYLRRNWQVYVLLTLLLFFLRVSWLAIVLVAVLAVLFALAVVLVDV